MNLAFLSSLRALIDAFPEWLIVRASGRSFPVLCRELEFELHGERMTIGFPFESGWETWRVDEIRPAENGIEARVSRSFGRERDRLRLVPRLPAAELRESVEISRLERADSLARAVRDSVRGSKLISVRLNREAGRLAQVLVETAFGRQIAACGDVSDSLAPETVIASAVKWLARLGRRKKHPVGELTIVAEPSDAARLQRLHALLADEWKSRLSVAEFSRGSAGHGEGELTKVQMLGIGDVVNRRTRKLSVPQSFAESRTATEIRHLAPGEIDAVFSRQGETLRYLGLPFARVRRTPGSERCWFGIDRERRLLTGENIHELARLVEDLAEFRRPDSPNRRHAMYRMAPEAWLESRLRRDIRRLDANLILSPVYQQFRAERDKIDILALRLDGRLVIVEIKVSPDRECLYQVADYWGKIERVRRSGRLDEAGIFGDRRIADAPAICYVVAPKLAFHPDFDFYASTISPRIEIHRFDLAENWRERLRVLERRRAV